MYDRLVVMSYYHPSFDFGGGSDSTYLIAIPRGAKLGRVLDINAYTSEAFVGTTTPGKIQVGKSGALTKYAELTFGSAATPTAINTSVSGRTAGQSLFKAVWRWNTDNLAYLTVTLKATVGGSVAGQADFTIHIGWDFASGATDAAVATA